MNKNLRTTMMMLAFGVVLTCAGGAYAQGVVLGGYKKVSTEDAGVRRLPNSRLRRRAKKPGSRSRCWR